MVQASSALIFMCVNQRFKILIACYLIHSIIGTEKQNILNNILHALYDFYIIDIRNVTFNANCRVCLFENESRAYFQNPYMKKTYWMHTCHILKLVI